MVRSRVTPKVTAGADVPQPNTQSSNRLTVRHVRRYIGTPAHRAHAPFRSPKMPPRTLASLAHALGASANLDTAFVALAEALAEVDRSTVLALYRYDARREMLRERVTMTERGEVERGRADTKLDHIPPKVRVIVSGGGQFVDLGERSEEVARLLGMRPTSDDGLLSLRGIPLDGHLEAVVALYEPRRIFGTRG